MRLPPRLRALTLLLAAPPLGGCLFAPSPTLEVRRATLSYDESRTRLITIELDAANPGGKPIPLQRVEYRVGVDGRTELEATRDANATLPAFGGREIALPAPVGADPAAADEVSFSARVSYRQPGWLAKILHDLRLYRPSASIDARLDPAPGPQAAPGG